MIKLPSPFPALRAQLARLRKPLADDSDLAAAEAGETATATLLVAQAGNTASDANRALQTVPDEVWDQVEVSEHSSLLPSGSEIAPAAAAPVANSGPNAARGLHWGWYAAGGVAVAATATIGPSPGPDTTAPQITGPGGSAGASTASQTVNENSSAVFAFASNEAVTYTLAGGDDADLFAITSAGVLSFRDPPNFESPDDYDGDNTYRVQVKAQDAAGNTSTQTVSITVTDVSETVADTTAPQITGPSGSAGASTATKSVAENGTAVHTFSANETVTWSVSGGADAAKFAISSGGALSFLTAPDYETPTDADGNRSYVVGVKAQDSAGNATIQTVTVNVTDVVETVADTTAPQITGPSGATGASSSASVAENSTAVHTFSANETVSWSINGGADAAKFAISSGGALSFLTAPDYETPSDADGNRSYVVGVKAQDSAGNATIQTVTVNVTDVNETVADTTAPQITGPSGGVGAGTSVKLVAENTTAVHTFTANETVTWSISGGADAGKFSLNAGTGALSFASAPDFDAPTDAGSNNVYDVQIKAQDAAGNSSTQNLAVTVGVFDGTAPSITGPSGSAGAANSSKTVTENTTAVHRFTANEAVTWSIGGGTDASFFSIDASTGQLSFKNAPDFEAPADAGANNSYFVQVKAEDAAGNGSTQTLIVSVGNADEIPPVITGPDNASGSTASVHLVERDTLDVYRFIANEAVTWSLSGGADRGQFTLDASTGQLRFATAPDFEAPSDVGGNNTYEVEIKAVDAVGNSSTQSLSVVVDNLADETRPTLSIQSSVADMLTGPATLFFNFDEAVTGFSADDITLSSGSKGLFAGSGAQYSLEVTPGYGVGILTASVAANVAKDGSNNDNQAAALELLYETPGAVPGDTSIDLGALGKLIKPVKVDGDNWYYYWDKNANGLADDTQTHDALDALFTQDVSGTVGGGGNTTDTYRFATLNGVRVALPTIGESPVVGGYRPGTETDNSPVGETNVSYGDLLAVWDAHNGTGTATNVGGTPSGWAASGYWAATADGDGHAVLYLYGGNVLGNGYDNSGVHVAVQVW